MNSSFRIIDLVGNPIVGKNVVFTSVNSPGPSISESLVGVGDPVTKTTDTNGTITCSLFPTKTIVSLARPEPETLFYLNTDASVISASNVTGSLNTVDFNLNYIDFLPFGTKKVTVTPQRDYVATFSGSLVALGAVSWRTDSTGSFITPMIPGTYLVECYGRVTTPFYVCVPSSGTWNVSELIAVKPAKGVKIKVTDTDNSFVLTVSASDARYQPKGNVGSTLTTGSTYPITSSWAITASYAKSGGTLLTTGSTYPITASWSNNTVQAVSASYLSGSRAVVNLISASAGPSASVYTIGDVTSGTITQENGPYNLTALTVNYQFNVYAYRDIPGGGRVYSTNYYALPATDDGTENTFRWSLSWGGVANASGYRIIIQDDFNSFNFDHNVDVAGTSTTYDGSPVDVQLTVTPKTATVGSGDGTALYVNGNSKFIGDINITGTGIVNIVSASKLNVGTDNVITGLDTLAQGTLNLVSGDYASSQGVQNTSSNYYSHTQGTANIASGIASSAQGEYNLASGEASHAEGTFANAVGNSSHAEGYYSLANGTGCHAEGNVTTASGYYSHAEGQNTFANAFGAHAEGNRTMAIGNTSHAEGEDTVALGASSHAGGQGTIASGSYQTVVGKYNTKGNTSDVFVVGGGTSDTVRSDLVRVSTASIQFGVPITASYLNGTASFANQAITASYALNGGGAALGTGSTYPFTSSWAVTSSFALSASWAPTASWLVTGSTYPITASWASNVLTASYLTTTNNYTVNQFTASSLLSATGKFTGIVSGSSKMRVDDYIFCGKQVSFDATGGPIYFGNFESPASGRAGFSVPGEVIQGVDANSKRFGFGGGGTHFVTNGPLCLVEIRARANETQFGILGHASQTADILYVSTSAAPVFRIKATGHVTASVITASAFVPNCRTVVADYTVTGLDSTIIFSGSAPLTASLPSAVGSSGLMYNIKNVAPYTLYVSGSQFIDNESYKLVTQWNTMTVQSNGTQWYII